MVFSYNWNASFEALPTDDNYGYEIDDYIRMLCIAVRERMEVDHIWKVGATDGEHKKITFSAQIAKPTNVANQLFLYTKDVSAKVELFAEDEDADEIQITSGGVLNTATFLPSGTKSIFYQDVAPTGWTIQNTLDDKLIFVSKGSAAGGQTGGGVHSTGTWTQPNHTHSHTHTGPSHTHTGPSHVHGMSSHTHVGGGHILTTDEMPVHSHARLATNGAGTYGGVYALADSSHAGNTWLNNSGDAGSGNSHNHGASGAPSTLDTAAAGTGATGADGTAATGSDATAGATAATWRPAAYCVIIASKN